MEYFCRFRPEAEKRESWHHLESAFTLCKGNDIIRQYAESLPGKSRRCS